MSHSLMAHFYRIIQRVRMVVRVQNKYGLPAQYTSLSDRIMFGGNVKQSRFKKIAAQSKKLKNRIVQQIFNKFTNKKRGGTLYGTKHQRGRKKKNKGKKQRGGESAVRQQSIGNLMMSKMGEQITPMVTAALQKYMLKQLTGGE